ncbi:MAG TPA: methyl-accepting chemotaxis protein, partial [Candidatus Baltobacteraceae bacterium]|nr:methyl-accepting chemotaxis protein [Candidatus Baltobacteraceae bacterium]
MNAKRTSLERGLILSFALVIAVLIFGVIPTSFWVMGNISTQAETLHAIIVAQNTYVKAQADADTLRANSIDAATNPDQGKAEASYLLANTAMGAFPKDSRSLQSLTAQDSDVKTFVEKFVASANAYDFQALPAMTLLGNNKKADALKIIHGPSYVAYDQQSRDGQALLNALKHSSDTRFAALMQARSQAVAVVVAGAAIAAVIALLAMLWFRRAMARGLERVLDVFEAMGRGDLTARVNFSGRDLLGRFGQAVDQLGDRLAQIIATIQQAVLTVQSASQHTNETARQVESRVSEELVALAHAAELSTSVRSTAGSVTDNAEQVARRVTDISSAVAEMTASIQEMDQNLLNLATVVEQAVANTQEMSASIVQGAGNAERVRQES